MKLRLMFLATPLMICACSHTHFVQDTESWYSFENINKKLEGQVVMLLFMDDRMDSGTIVSLGKDTTSYVQRSAGEIMRVPTRSLRSLQVEKPGTWDGAGLGFLIGGAGTALVFGVSAASSQSSDFPVGLFAAFGFTVGGLGGGVVGLIIGSTATSVDTYMFSSEENK
jgi:hypothetical protein